MLEAPAADIFSQIGAFFSSGAWLALEWAGLFFVCVFWLASAYAVYKDARRRIDSPLAVGACVAIAVFPPFLGALLYRVVRPAEYADEARARALARRAVARAAALSAPCPACERAVRAEFLACPFCGARLRDPCRGCSRPLDDGWRACPRCGTVTGRGPAEPEARRAALRTAPVAAAARLRRLGPGKVHRAGAAGLQAVTQEVTRWRRLFARP